MPLDSPRPLDTINFRLGGYLIPALRRWYDRTLSRALSDPSFRGVYWPGWWLMWDFHFHCLLYEREDSVSPLAGSWQVAIRTPWFLVLFAWRGWDLVDWSFSWRTELRLAWRPIYQWRVQEGQAAFGKEWSKVWSRWMIRGKREWRTGVEWAEFLQVE